VLCSGNSATLTASGASTYSWSTGATTSQIVVTPTSNTTYTLVGSNGVCNVSRTITIAAGTTPILVASTSNSFICAGQTVTLSATGAASYTYNPGGITGNPIALSPTASVVYTVSGSNGGPCIGVTTITQSVSACTGIDINKLTKVEFGVFPNPGNGEFSVICEDAEGALLEIYNVTGQKIRNKVLTEDLTSVNLSEQSDGIYYLRIVRSGKTVFTEKVIKQ
jgi:hypothetical protein